MEVRFYRTNDGGSSWQELKLAEPIAAWKETHRQAQKRGYYYGNESITHYPDMWG